MLTGPGHWGHQATGLYYNGHKHDEVTKGTHLGVQSECFRLLDTTSL
jgi:hypothetical protein